MMQAVTGGGLTHPKETSTEAIRYHNMDNLRAIAMLSGIFFHAALAYSPLMHNLWLTADMQNSAIMDAASWFMHLFRMPVFFLISGFFAIMLIEKRNIKGFLKNRLMRIVLPFVVFLPLVIISLMVVVAWSIGHVENLSPMQQLIAATHNNPDVPKPPFSTTHLWFLFNLSLFCIVIALLSKFRFFELSLTKKMANAKFIVLAFPLLLVPALFTQPSPLPAPERMYPELWSFGFFGMFFLLGGLIYNNPTLLDSLRKYIIGMLIFSLSAYGLLYSYIPKQVTLEEVMIVMQQGIPRSWEQLLKSVLTAYISVHMTLVCLLASRSLLNNHSKAFRFIAESSYWVYIVHLPVLFYIQFLLMDVELNFWIKFLLGSFGTLMVGIVSYVVLVRWTPIGWLLNGRNKSQ